MIETNLRIVSAGTNLRLPVRYATVKTAHTTSEAMERACNLLSYHYGVAARPVPGRENEIVVLAEGVFSPIRIEDESTTITVEDSGKDASALRLSDTIGRVAVPALVERALLAHLPAATSLWRLDSPRKWLQKDSFVCRQDIEAYRRFECSGLLVDGVGVAVSVDVSTAFLSMRRLDYYFADALSPQEAKRRQELFSRLTSRQQGQKGTLVYRVGSMTRVCYFEKCSPGQTCGRTPEIKIQGKTYSSLFEYYAQRYPDAKVGRDEQAVLVSFQGLGQSVWVAARFLQVRVMNDSLPDSLASVDKISPAERVRMIEEFWSALGHTPFGKVPVTLIPGFWRPGRERVMTVSLPEVEFSNGKVLSPPGKCDAASYQQHFRQRGEMLESAGVQHLPMATDRTIHCAYPHGIGEEAAKQLAGDVARALSKWSKVPFKTNLVAYNQLTDATTRLRSSGVAGTVLFVLDDSPTSYYDSAYHLPGWRVKRVTESSLQKHFRYLREGVRDKKTDQMNLRKGWQKWDRYVQMNALGVLQLMDAIPYRIATIGDYEAQLAIDVGYDRRHVAMSLLVARTKTLSPSFRIVTEVQAKTDHKLETINPTILADMIVQTFGRAFRGKFDPLRSLLVIRDGQFRGEEKSGVYQALLKLKEKGFLALDAASSLAELHKTSQKNIRFWERETESKVVNPLECQAVMLSANIAVLATTGESTLTQGTAEPMVIACEGAGELLPKVVEAMAAGAQLNWGSPGVAQRLPIVFKRTDEELEVRYAQEIRRIA